MKRLLLSAALIALTTAAALAEKVAVITPFLAQPGIDLEDLFVKPEFRGAGTGKALLLHLAKIANTRGCGRMEWSVLDWNEPAKGFYRKLGAVPLEDWRVMRLTGSALHQYA